MFLERLNYGDEALAVERVRRAHSGQAYALPPDTEMDIWRIFDDLDAAERGLVAPTRINDAYILGTARKANEIRLSLGKEEVLVTTEHATAHWLPPSPGYAYRRLKGFEAGTAAIGGLLTQKAGAGHATLAGRQTGNANQDLEHPFKVRIKRLVRAGLVVKYVSLHGMSAGLVHELSDERSFDVLIGIGDRPNAESVRLAKRIESAATGLGLRAGINQEFLHIETLRGQKYVVVDAERNPMRRVYKAPEMTMRAAVQTAAEEEDIPVAAVQVELSSALRILPVDHVKKRFPPLGPALGYVTLLRGLDLIDSSVSYQRR